MSSTDCGCGPRDWHLNERHYGGLTAQQAGDGRQGGAEQVKIWPGPRHPAAALPETASDVSNDRRTGESRAEHESRKDTIARAYLL